MLKLTTEDKKEIDPPLYKFIENWLEERGKHWKWLLDQADLSGAVGTEIRKGAVPRPGNLGNLADAMKVERRFLLQLVGYVKPEELEPPVLTAFQQQVLSLVDEVPEERRDWLLRVVAALTEPDARSAGREKAKG